MHFHSNNPLWSATMKLLKPSSVFCAAMLAALAICASTAWAQPHIGYLYPAGGRAGDIFSVTVGGQNLQNITGVYVSGEGVRLAGIRYMGRLRPLNRAQMMELRRRLDEIRLKRSGATVPEVPNTRAVRLPNDPLLDSLDDLSESDLQLVAREFLDPNKKQTTKNSIAERVIIQLMIDPDATPGDRELRLIAPVGLTNPMCFQVGSVREYDQKDLNPATPLALPALVNGQILPAEVDRVRFSARSGQRLVVRAQARHLIPYMADAVPGWFQAVIALYDAQGRQLACTDHYLFDPDPVLFYAVPADAEYQLEVRDSIYRGREDFVYRVSIGEQPFITQVFPLGGQAGVPASAAISGWNLPESRLTLDTEPGGAGIRQTAWRGNDAVSNDVLYAVDPLPECRSVKPNSTAQTAQPVTLPIVVNGRIERPGDANVFRFEGRGGDEVVAEVQARRLGSPLDSFLRLTDAAGKVLAWNDDYPDKECGLLTHQADSWLCAKLPADGTYYVWLTDAENAGSDAHVYRLRISAPQPDFALRISPSAINLLAGRATPVWVYAIRKDGFDGDIEIALDGAPAGFKLSGNVIPHGRDSVRMTLTPARIPPQRTTALRVVGRAEIAGATVTRAAVPADNEMQAFAYWHLVPAQELLATVAGNGGPTFVLPQAASVVKIPAGGETQIQVNCPPYVAIAETRFDLVEPPKGLSVGEIAVVKGGLTLTLKAAADPAGEKPGYTDNLIVEAYTLEAVPGGQGRPAVVTRRGRSYGNLPAIPIEIVSAAE
jgi:hypothetical protein